MTAVRRWLWWSLVALSLIVSRVATQKITNTTTIVGNTTVIEEDVVVWRTHVKFSVIAGVHLDTDLGSPGAGGPALCQDANWTNPDVLAVDRCASTPRLVVEALETAGKQWSKSDALFVIGPFTAPNVGADVTATTITELMLFSQILANHSTAFPEVFVSPGRDDFTGNLPGWFDISGSPYANNDALAVLETAFAPWLPWHGDRDPPGSRAAIARSNFLRFGAHAKNATNGAPLIYISLNCVIMLLGLQPHDSDWYANQGLRSLVDEQMDWLEDILYTAAWQNKTAIITGEMAFGVDVGPDGENKANPTRIWAYSAAVRFRQVLDRHCDTIAALVFSEHFKAELRLLTGSTCKTPMVNVGGLAPMRGNNPTISQITLGFCEQQITSWLQLSIPMHQKVGERSPALLRDRTKSLEGDFSLSFNMLSFYGSATLEAVRSFLTTMLQRTSARHFSLMQSAAFGGIPAHGWGFGEQRAIICSQLFSVLKDFDVCIGMCPPLSVVISPEGWNGFPPPMMFTQAPFAVLLLGLAFFFAFYLPYSFVIQVKRLRDLRNVAHYIAAASPEAAEIITITWNRVHMPPPPPPPEPVPAAAATVDTEEREESQQGGEPRAPSANGKHTNGGDAAGDDKDVDASHKDTGAIENTSTLGSFGHASVVISDAPDADSSRSIELSPRGESAKKQAPVDAKASDAPAKQTTSAAAPPVAASSQGGYLRLDTRDEKTGKSTQALLEWDAALEAFGNRHAWCRRSAFYSWARMFVIFGPPGSDDDRLLLLVQNLADARVALHRAAKLVAAEQKFYDDGFGASRPPGELAALMANMAIYERCYIDLARMAAHAWNVLQEGIERTAAAKQTGDRDDVELTGKRSGGAKAKVVLKEATQKVLDASSKVLDVLHLGAPAKELQTWFKQESGTLYLSSNRFGLNIPLEVIINAPPREFRPDAGMYRDITAEALASVSPDPSLVTSSKLLALCDAICAAATVAKLGSNALSPAEMLRNPQAAAQAMVFGAANLVVGSIKKISFGILSITDVEGLTRPSVVQKEWRDAMMRLGKECNTKPLTDPAGDPEMPAAGPNAEVPWLWRELRTLRRYFLLYWYAQLHPLAEGLTYVQLVNRTRAKSTTKQSFLAWLKPDKVTWFRLIVFIRILFAIAALVYGQLVLYQDLPPCTIRTIGTVGEAMTVVFLALMAASQSKPYCISLVSFIIMWYSATSLADARFADFFEITLMVGRAMTDVGIFLSSFAASRTRPQIPHPHLMGATDTGAVFAWSQATKKPEDNIGRVLVGPRAADSVKPVAFDLLSGVKSSSMKLHWFLVPKVTGGPNLLASIEIFGTCSLAVFNALAGVFMADLLGKIVTNCVNIMNGTALPSDAIALPTRVVFFSVASIAGIAGSYCVRCYVTAVPRRDGTCSYTPELLPLVDIQRRWIMRLFHCSMAVCVMVVMSMASMKLVYASIVFIVLDVLMHFRLFKSGHSPSPPWWIATHFAGSISVYVPILFNQAVNCMNVIAVALLAFLLVNDPNILRGSNNARQSSALKLMFLLKAFAPAVDEGLGPSIVWWILYFMRVNVRRKNAAAAKRSAKAAAAAAAATAQR